MYLKNIINQDIATLTNCESEPIHIPGAIQPHGFLFCITPVDFRIAYCSANAGAYCGIDYTAMLGRSFATVFGQAEAGKIQAYLLTRDFKDGNPLSLLLGKEDFSCTITTNPQGYLIEAEPFPNGFQSLHDLYRQTRRFVAILERTTSLQELCQSITEETQRITGYDRVMVYRFDKDYNGEIYAETCRGDLEPFLNLHYPHTDIPVQARKLYLRNLLRMIVDAGYEAVPIYTTSAGPDAQLDLSASLLRSVSPIHIEYLKNMGVEATLTISLIHEQKLWGLISCHHYSPKILPHYTRISAQLQGHFLASQISVRGVAEAFETGIGIGAAMDVLLQHTSHSEADIMELSRLDSLLKIAGADGVAIIFKGRSYSNGVVPDTAAIMQLCPWLFSNETDGSYTSNHLSGAYPDAAALGPVASGVIYHSLISGGEHCIIWFRGESKQEVLWAGDPSKAIVKDEKGLSPRKSFALWKELTSLHSFDWSGAEQQAAANFAHGFQRQLSLILLRIEEARIRVLNEQLRQANEELESMNWISTHDLQEPLRKLQVFASQLLQQKSGTTMEEVMDIVRRMSKTAGRMQQLVIDVHEYTKVLAVRHVLKPVDLNDILSEVLYSLGDEPDDKQAVITCQDLPVVYGEPFLLRQLFVNLLRNALKFSREGTTPVITVSCSIVQLTANKPGHAVPGRYYKVSVADNGIGFSNKYADSIFGLFKRLHGPREYGGTGIGLAICRKVMQLHDGVISAEGTEGQGAVFLLYFPEVEAVNENKAVRKADQKNTIAGNIPGIA